MEAVDWEFTGCPPHARLDGLVLRYEGYTIESERQWRRRELPSTTLPLVISFGDAFTLDGTSMAAFVGGLQETSVLTGWPARVRGVQVDLSVLGARLLLGVPMSELTGRIVALADVLGPLAGRLAERLYELPDWPSRFGLLDEVFLSRLDAADSPGHALTWAWRRIHDSGGNLDIVGLARELAYSRQHLTARFRSAFGVPPKTLARLRRFERAARPDRRRQVAAGGRGAAYRLQRSGPFQPGVPAVRGQCSAGAPAATPLGTIRDHVVLNGTVGGPDRRPIRADIAFVR